MAGAGNSEKQDLKIGQSYAAGALWTRLQTSSFILWVGEMSKVLQQM